MNLERIKGIVSDVVGMINSETYNNYIKVVAYDHITPYEVVIDIDMFTDCPEDFKLEGNENIGVELATNLSETLTESVNDEGVDAKITVSRIKINGILVHTSKRDIVINFATILSIGNNYDDHMLTISEYKEQLTHMFAAQNFNVSNIEVRSRGINDVLCTVVIKLSNDDTREIPLLNETTLNGVTFTNVLIKSIDVTLDEASEIAGVSKDALTSIMNMKV